MNIRERLLAVVLTCLIVAGVAGAGGYLLVYEPIRQKWGAAAQLEKEIADLTAKRDQFAKDRKRLEEVVKRRSLPPDESLARREYNDMLSRLVRRAGIPVGSFSVTQNTNPDAKGIPVLPGGGKKPAYTKVVSVVEFQRADMWAVRDFLEGYYKLNLLHQITNLSVKRADDAASAGARNKPADNRKDLSVKLTTEAIILDGAEPRMTLLTVSKGFAAVGGWAGYSAIADTPEAGRGLTPVQLAPVLATKPRDYSFLAVKDVFHGPLPTPAPLKVERIPDVAVRVGDPIGPITVPLGGDFDYLGKITLSATVNGDLLPADAVVVDPAGRTITVTPPEGETGSSTITVVARSEIGTEAKGTFRVTVDPPKVVVKEDVSAAIRLILVSTASDGTATALIRDNATRQKYEIEATRRRVKVTKFFYGEGSNAKRKDPDYHDPDQYVPDELVIAPDGTSTRRRFKVVAVDDAGLIVQDLQPPEAPAPKPAGKGGAKGGKDAKPKEPAGPAKAASDAPVAAPTLYRWAAGKSLAGLVKLSPEEAEKVLRRAAEAGPVGATAVAATGN
ncbi:MAG: Ig domain-containing protein [Gemmataceae bacterium]|nr:Ig domain-containing protein [Gemmataceae bacterium]